jgi:hypothetical protein
VPTQYGVKLDDEQRLFPGAQPGGQEGEQGAVASGEDRALGLSFEHHQLLPQQSVLKH